MNTTDSHVHEMSPAHRLARIAHVSQSRTPPARTSTLDATARDRSDAEPQTLQCSQWDNWGNWNNQI